MESILVDENQSLGKPEKAEDGCESKIKYLILLCKRESEDLQKEKSRLKVCPFVDDIHRKSAVAIFIVTAFIFLSLLYLLICQLNVTK